MISYNSENVKVPQIRRRDTSAWIKKVAALHGKKVGDIAYIFCDDEKILEVNRQYLQHDRIVEKTDRTVCGFVSEFCRP